MRSTSMRRPARRATSTASSRCRRGAGAPMTQLEVPFGEELVHYAVGASSCAVPGLPAGLAELSRAHGRLPWRALVEPALRLARTGVAMPAAHASCLAMLEPVMTMREGARLYAPGRRLLAEGDLLDQPGLVAALELSATRARPPSTRARLPRRCSSSSPTGSGTLTADDLARLPGRVVRARRGDVRGQARADARRARGRPRDARPLRPGGGPARAARRARRRRTRRRPHDEPALSSTATGTRASLTTSLGLGSGDWLPGLDLHLNSMLGETDLVRGALVPGTRMESMMAPTFALDGDGLELALGAAGGTRLRTALVGVLGGVLHDRLEAQEAIDRPRFHPAGDVVNAEPGVDEDVAPAARSRRQAGAALGGPPPLLRRGQRRRRARARGADPRRSGLALRRSVGTVVAIQPR